MVVFLGSCLRVQLCRSGSSLPVLGQRGKQVETKHCNSAPLNKT